MRPKLGKLLPFLLLAAAALCEIGVFLAHRRWPNSTWLVHAEGVAAPLLILAVVWLSPRKGRLLALVAAVALLLATLVPGNQPFEGQNSIRIDKTNFTLTVMAKETILLKIPVGLGPNPGAKERLGDGRTPEGHYRVANMEVLPDQHWVGLNYPNSLDALRGRRDGLLTWAETWLILVQNRFGRTPFQGSALGNGIGIHRGPHFTAGSIGATVEDLARLYPLVTVGTPVEILP